MPDQIRSILLVCTGNTCRSPLAEALLMKRCHDEGMPIIAQSAGVGAAEGLPPSQEAAAVAKEIGLDLSAHRSQPITDELVEGSDLILSMTTGQLNFLRLSHPEAAEKASPLLVYAHGEHTEDEDVEDPLGSGIEAYRETARILSEAVEAIIDKLRQAAE